MTGLLDRMTGWLDRMTGWPDRMTGLLDRMTGLLDRAGDGGGWSVRSGFGPEKTASVGPAHV
jgi:hypothetical protein